MNPGLHENDVPRSALDMPLFGFFSTGTGIFFLTNPFLNGIVRENVSKFQKSLAYRYALSSHLLEKVKFYL
jgi:hypothetical protein